MAEDYRNLSSHILVGGLDLLHTPDTIPEGRWARLTNVENNIDGQLEQRPTVDLWLDYTRQSGQALTGCSGGGTGGSSFTLDYPFDYAYGAYYLRNVYYVGQVDDNGTDRNAFLFAQDNESVAGEFRWFLNGWPVILDTVWDGTNYTTQAILSTAYDNMVLSNTPKGVPIVIIGGQYYVSLRDPRLDLNAMPTVDSTGSSLVLDFTNDGGLTYLDCPDVEYVPAYRLGIPKPADLSSVSITSGGSLTQTSGAGKIKGSTKYSWRYTYYNSVTGAESPPSAASSPLATTSSNKTGTMTVTNSTDPQVDKIRIYRKGGILTGSWRLSKTISNDASTATTATTDAVADSTITTAETIDPLLIEPFNILQNDGTTATTKLKRAFGPFKDRYVFYFGDALNPHYVWWTEPNDPFRTKGDTSVNKFAESGEKIRRGFVYNGQPYVFTNSNLYAMEFGGADALPAFSMRKTPVEVGLACDYGIAIGEGILFFVGFDGIYATDTQGTPSNITNEVLKPLFQGIPRNGYKAIDWDQAQTKDMNLSYSNGRLYFWFMDTAGLRVCYVMDVARGIWYNWNFEVYTDFGTTGLLPQQNITQVLGSGVATNPISDKNPTLLLTRSGYSFFLDEHDRGAATQLGTRAGDYGFPANPDYGYPGEALGFPVTARSASLDGGIPHTEKLYGTLIVDYDPDNISIACTPLYDSEETSGVLYDYTGSAITNNLLQQGSPTSGRRVDSFDLGDIYAKSIALEFSWRSTNFVIDTTGGGTDQAENAYVTGGSAEWKYFIPGKPKIYSITILYRADEEEIKHWEHQEDSFGHHGWFHIRDGFFDITSNANVALVLTVDGTAHSYTLASTSGARRKVYQEFDAIRGKVVRVDLDSASPFRFYSDSSYLYSKDWQSGLAYEPAPLAGAAGYADFLRKGGGT